MKKNKTILFLLVPSLLTIGLILFLSLNNRPRQHITPSDDRISTKNTEDNSGQKTSYSGKIGQYVHYAINLGIKDAGNIDDDWVVFYEGDNGFTYLIASSYVPNNNQQLISSARKSGLTQYDKYSNRFDKPPIPAKITDSVADKFKLSWQKEGGQTKYEKHHAAAALLNPDNWNDFALKNIDAQIMAVGAPTLDLLLASWLQRGYPAFYIATNVQAEKTGNKLALNYGSGYLISANNPPKADDYALRLPNNYNHQDPSLKNKVYFPVETELDECRGYWIASPSAVNGQADLFSLMPRFKQVQFQMTNSPETGLRPVVAIPTNIIGQDSNSGRAIYFVK